MVSRGERPPKPASAEVLGLTPAVWKLTKECWHKKAAKRPNTSEILARLEGMMLPTCSVSGFIDEYETNREDLAFALRVGGGFWQEQAH